MRKLVLLVTLALLSTFSHHASARNYMQVVCDDEPDPVLCAKIQNWYYRAATNDGKSCCGEADAYWTDQIDKVTKDGLYVTVTDDRDCKVYYDDDGIAVPQTDACIPRRVPRNGQQLWIPNEKIDHWIVREAKGPDHRQGNPTGHVVTFISQNAALVDPEGKAYPGVYCFMPGGGL